MAFKGGSDDIRSSLSYKLKRILRFKASGVLCTDPFVSRRSRPVPLEEVLERSDLLIVGTPHPIKLLQATLEHLEVPMIDVWDLHGPGRWCCEAPSFGRRHRLQRGRGHRRVPRPIARVGDAALRGARRLRLPGRHDGAVGREVRQERRPGRPHAEHLRARARHGPSASGSTMPRPTWSS